MPRKKKPKVRILDCTEECEPIEIKPRARQVPDPDWSFVDSAGQTHKWDGDELPTLERRRIGRYWCLDCEEHHELFEWIVPATDEVVEPGYIWKTPERTFIAGSVSIQGTFLRLSSKVTPGDVIAKDEIEWPGGLDPEKSVGGSIRLESVNVDDVGDWVAVAPGWGME